MRRSYFAHAVSGDRAGRHAPFPPYGRQRYLHGEKQRLDMVNRKPLDVRVQTGPQF